MKRALIALSLLTLLAGPASAGGGVGAHAGWIAMDEAGDVLWASVVAEEAFAHYYEQALAHLVAQGTLAHDGPILAAVEAQYIGLNRATGLVTARRAAIWEGASLGGHPLPPSSRSPGPLWV